MDRKFACYEAENRADKTVRTGRKIYVYACNVSQASRKASEKEPSWTGVWDIVKGA